MNRFVQKELSLPPLDRGIHLITGRIIHAIPEVKNCSAGVLHIFIKHTSASLSLNENASPDVRIDMENFLDHLVPDGFELFIHTAEGPDDMPAHIKSALLGNSLSLPVSGGKINLGTWQGIYLCEHRNRGGRRDIVLTLQGDFN